MQRPQCKKALVQDPSSPPLRKKSAEKVQLNDDPQSIMDNEGAKLVALRRLGYVEQERRHKGHAAYNGEERSKIARQSRAASLTIPEERKRVGRARSKLGIGATA